MPPSNEAILCAQKLGRYAAAAFHLIPTHSSNLKPVTASQVAKDPKTVELKKLTPNLDHKNIIEEYLIHQDNELGPALKKEWDALSAYWTQFQQHGGTWQTLKNHLADYFGLCGKW